MACDRTEQSKSNFLIVLFLRNTNCRPASFLFMTCLRIKIKPDLIAFFGNIS